MGCLKLNVFIKKPVNLKQSLTIYSYIIYYTTSLTDEAKIVTFPGEKPQRIFKDLQGSLKICKDLQKIFENEDLSRILKGSLKDL